MRKAFLEFLTSQDAITSECMHDIRTLLRVAREPIGSIAFRYGMLSAGDIDCILEEQRASHRPFGQIALETGMLIREQLNSLLCVQQIRAVVETAEALALSGLCPVDEIMGHLGRFLSEICVTEVCLADARGSIS